MIAQIKPAQPHLIVHHPDSLESAEHRFDAGQPTHGLFVWPIGIGKRKVDARLYRPAVAHFVEQIVHRC